ncbi:hypothetical protein V5N11_004603 [Cardamine amara subsp. amara]|uniref:Cystatin domain-containing protein n=1 Tax=Cardamine amara subsp. amara TaxID=228776 RepID=A0ABD1BJR6_CARAN
MTSEYEIISDPFHPKCIRAFSMYRPGEEPKKAKRFMERVRGKEEDMIHRFTRDEEYHLINEQIRKTQGFDVDFSMFRVFFDFYPALLNESSFAEKPETDRDYFGRLAKEAIQDYNNRQGTSFEFVEVDKANIHMNSGFTYFITFVVKGHNDVTQIFQAKVINVFCREEFEHCFCRPKPIQQVECDKDSRKAVKKRRNN